MGRPRKTKTTEDTVNKIMNTEIVEEFGQEEIEEVEEKVVEKPKAKKTAPKKRAPKKPQVKKSQKKIFAKTDDVLVKSLINGRLGYENDRTGYAEMWNEFGEELYMPYSELLHIKGKHRRFFEDNWIIREWEVLDSLGVTKYYSNIIDVDSLEDVFKDKDNFKETFKSLPKGLRQTVIDKASEMKISGELDSMKIIKDIKDISGFDLGLIGDEG